MFRIGDFSRLGQVSVKTLHHYDEIGLLQPAKVDPETGYRYYSADQLWRLNRIIALKWLGFSLGQIAEVLEDGLSPDQIRGMLRLRKAETEQRLMDEQERLAQVDMWLKKFEEEHKMPKFDVTLKKLDPQLVASIRQEVPGLEALAPLFPEIESHINTSGGSAAGPGMIIYHDTEHCEDVSDAEAAIPIASKLPGTGRIKVYEIPQIEVASLVYTGCYEEVQEAHQALAKWIEDHGYELAGPNRVVFLNCENPDKTTIDIQYSVKKS